MNRDISNILDGWEYQQDELNVRLVRGRDGREKVQLRLDLGLLQMDVDGRPDGKKPFGKGSLFAYYKELAKAAASLDTGESTFSLDSDECSKLWQEAVQYYHRYLSFFQLEDYERAARDTIRNLDLFDFVKKHARDEEDIGAFEQYRPYVLMMNFRAKALLCLRKKDFMSALDIIEDGIQVIRQWYDETEQIEDLDEGGEIAFLEQWANTIRASQPLTRRERLEHALNRAISLQEYERAAELRDEISHLLPPASPQ